MNLLALPIPARPAEFSPHGAPPGVEVDLGAFKWDDGTPWWEHRPLISPTTQVLHTNAAQREGNLQSQINWGNAGIRSNTHPHYAVNRPQPTKLVPTNRRAIGNSSLYTVEREAGVMDCSFWSIVIETADAGYVNGVPVDGRGDFLYDHAEITARIMAYESIVHNIPLAVPETWTEPGTITHTWPFPYPYFTIAKGKTCPGAAKKITFRVHLLARARQIRAAWLEEAEMEPEYLFLPPAPYAGKKNPFFYVKGASVRYATGFDVELARSSGVEFVRDDQHPDRYYSMHVSVMMGREPIV